VSSVPRAENPIDPNESSLAAFAVDLRELRKAAGQPTYRELARRAHYAAPALSKAASGRYVPSWACVEAYLAACGIVDPGAIAEWRQRWEVIRAKDRQSPTLDRAEPTNSRYGRSLLKSREAR
jgi:hypothetical protein